MERATQDTKPLSTGGKTRFTALSAGVLLGGILLGASLAILAAPFSGEKMRDILWEKSIFFRDHWINPYAEHPPLSYESIDLPVFPLDEDRPLHERQIHPWQRAINSLMGLVG